MRVIRSLRRISVPHVQTPDSSVRLIPTIISEGEHVLFLGEIDNMKGSAVISTWEGRVLWPMKLEDFGEIDEHLRP